MDEVKEAEENFQAIYQKKNIAIDLQKVNYDSNMLDENGQCSLIDCIFSLGIYKSKSEVRRLIQQGAVKVNGEKTKDLLITPANDMVIQVGKGTIFKLSQTNEKQMFLKR